MRASFSFFLLLFWCLAHGWPRMRLLVVVDDLTVRESHSRLFDALHGADKFDLVFRRSSDASLLSAENFGFSAVILFLSESSESSLQWRSLFRVCATKQIGLFVVGKSVLSEQLGAHLGVRVLHTGLLDHMHRHASSSFLIEGKISANVSWTSSRDPPLYEGPSLELRSKAAKCIASGHVTAFGESESVCFLARVALSSVRVVFLGSMAMGANNRIDLVAPSTKRPNGNLELLRSAIGWVAGRCPEMRVRQLSVSQHRMSIFVTTVLERRSESDEWVVQRDHHIARAILVQDGKQVAALPLVANSLGKYVQQFEVGAPGDFVVRIESDEEIPLYAYRFIRIKPEPKPLLEIIHSLCVVIVGLGLIFA